VHLLFDIFQGVGIAAAVGIRPFLPALAVGALAAAGVQIAFNGTDYSFLQQLPFLAALAVSAAALLLVERQLRRESQDRRPLAISLGLIAVVIGALLFAASLARGHYTSWPGLIGGAACAALALAATRPLLVRVRARLDEHAAAAVPLYAEAAGVALAALSVVAPPVGPVALALLVWLLLGTRRRAERKYAGLRILR